MADGIITACNVARSSHWFRQVTALCSMACGSGVWNHYSEKVKEVNLYSAFIVVPHTQGAQVWITQCYLQITPHLPLPRKHSPDGASPDWGCGHLIAAYYSFIYPAKGWKAESAWLADLQQTVYPHNGHPSAAGRAQDSESSPVRDRRSTTVPRNQPSEFTKWQHPAMWYVALGWHAVEFARWQHSAMWHVALGSWHWIRQVAALCNVAGGSGMTCHGNHANVRHIGILHLVSILTILPQSTCHSALICEILSKSDHPQQRKLTSCRFSRWRIWVFLGFRGPIMDLWKPIYDFL